MYSDNNYGKTKTAEACQVMCKDNPECEWFNWGSNQNCYLQTDMGSKSQAKPGGATGPAVCGGK